MDLQHYLQKIEKNSPVDLIKLGLERVKKIAVELDVMELNAFVIMVAGTNGKGSTIATLEQLLVSHGKNVGTYTSPHLLTFNERIKINSLEVTELEIVKVADAKVVIKKIFEVGVVLISVSTFVLIVSKVFGGEF